MHPMSRPLIPALLLGGLTSATALADPGALDRWGCHNDGETGEYHCHGDESRASLGGIAIGAGLRTASWFYLGENNLNLFTGPSVDVEAGIGSFALQASYHYKVLVNSDDDITLSGWDVGAKVGRSVARYGYKLYGAAGYFYESLRRPDEDNYGLSGFYAGVGTGYNWANYGLDVQLDWHSPNGYEQFWEDQDEPADIQAFSLRTVFSYRF
jgi:hypothetical protein